jgi:hypothetical protein
MEYQPPTDFIVVEHRIILNGQEIYKGEDWGKAQQLFIKHVQSLDLDPVRHEVTKRAVPYYPWGNQPEK